MSHCDPKKISENISFVSRTRNAIAFFSGACEANVLKDRGYSKKKVTDITNTRGGTP
tara:strand:- start:192 stop:362 length:171 start_codon:yes stop_codon:yes gene_type:complete